MRLSDFCFHCKESHKILRQNTYNKKRHWYDLCTQLTRRRSYAVFNFIYRNKMKVFLLQKSRLTVLTVLNASWCSEHDLTIFVKCLSAYLSLKDKHFVANVPHKLPLRILWNLILSNIFIEFVFHQVLVEIGQQVALFSCFWQNFWDTHILAFTTWNCTKF